MKIIELNIDIFKKEHKEFTENEMDDFMDDFKKFIESKNLYFGGSHQLISKKDKLDTLK